jgi:hypothetical protein
MQSQSELGARVEWLCHEGDRHATAGEPAEAAACFLEAWDLLPAPREECPATAEVLRGLTRLLRARADGLEVLAGRPRFHAVLASLGLGGEPSP